MRTLIASLRIVTLLMIFALPALIGCGASSSEPEAYGKDSDPPEEGMVWNDKGEYWEFPNTGGGGDGYGGGYDYESGYEDPPTGDEVAEQDDEDSDNVDTGDEVAQSSNDGYDNDRNGADAYANTNGGGNDGYGDGYGSTDPYAKPSDSRGGVGDGYGADAYASTSSDGGAPAGGGTGVYAEKIEPLFRAHCYDCHGGGARGEKGGFSLHTPTAINDANVMKPYDAEDSELYIRVSLEQGEKGRMPPEGPGLSREEVALVRDWIQSGANFGSAGGGQGGGGGYGDGYGDGYANNGRPERGRGGRGGRDDDPYGDDDRGEPESSAPARPKNLAEASSVTFQRGDDLEAMNQLYAQTLVRDSEVAAAVLEKYRYVPALRRARLAVRWGIGVVYKPKYGYPGGPRPPGVKQNIRDIDDDDSDDVEYAGSDFRNELLDYYTGDIGDELLVRLQNRIELAFYGEVLRGELETKMGGGEDDEFEDDYGDGYGRGGRGGGYGSDGGYGGRGGGGSSDKPDGDRIEQVMPGVVVLGQAEQKTLLTRAAEQGVDLIAILDVVTEPDNRRKIADSEFRVRVYDVASPSLPIVASKRINNIDIQRARAKDPNDETIINAFHEVFEVLDNGRKHEDKSKVVRPYKVTEFPNTKSEKAKSGVFAIVKRLLENPSDQPLAKLSEVRFYESRGLLKESLAAAAFKKLSPDNADRLLKVVDENELRTMLSDWLVVDEPLSGDEDEESPRQRPSRGFR